MGNKFKTATEKIEVNLFDVMGNESLKEDGFQSFTSMVRPGEIKYKHSLINVQQTNLPDGRFWEHHTLNEGLLANAELAPISVYTDKCIRLDDPDYLVTMMSLDPTPVKVLWLLEVKEVHPDQHRVLMADRYPNQIEQAFDYIFTFDEELLRRGPKYIENLRGGRVLGGTDGGLSRARIYQKTKHISLIASKQNWLPGHKLRHEIVRGLDPLIDVHLWGRAYRPFPYGGKPLALAEYRYSIAVENVQGSKWFTEKIIDCLSTGTVPIYWGCPNIDKYFDINGIIYFESVEELNTILPTLNAEDYANRFESVKKNFELTKQWISSDDIFARNLKEVMKKHAYT